MGAIDEDVLRRARALNALANGAGGNEHEMSNAAEKLAAMLAKFNLDQSDLKEDTTPGLERVKVNGKYSETWRITCYSAAAQLFMCNYYYSKVGTKDVGIVHSLVGQPHNVAVAVEMAHYFEETINRLANEASRTHKEVTAASHTSRHRFIRSFRLAAAERLDSRVVQYTRRARAGTLMVEDDTGSELRLPALQSLYDQQKADFEAWKIIAGLTLAPSKAAKDQKLSMMGSALGNAAGDSISFSTQLGEGSKRHAIGNG